MGSDPSNILSDSNLDYCDAGYTFWSTRSEYFLSHIIDWYLSEIELLVLWLEVLWLCLQHVFISPMCDWVPMTLAFVTPFGCT